MSKLGLRLTSLIGLLVLTGTLLSRAPSQEQGDRFSIRVEANEVVVPVYVVYRNRETKVSEEENECVNANIEKFHRLKLTEPYLPADCDQIEVRGLGSSDIQLLEDGVRQTIKRVTFEPFPGLQVRDSSGDHEEYSKTESPTGKWSLSDRSQLLGVEPFDVFNLYRLLYTPPHSAPGSCHSIKVTARRRGARVYARTRYCNVQYVPSDPLKGTEFGRRLEEYGNSSDEPRIPLFAQAAVHHTTTTSARANISVEFPPELLTTGFVHGSLNATIGLMGIVYKDGAIEVRFSDFACCDPDFSLLARGGHPELVVQYLERAATPERYETQLDLSPGKYNLKIVLSDGAKFGRIEIPLSIEKYDDKQLGLSSIALCKRYLDAARAAKEAAAVNLAPQYVPLVSKGVQFEPAGDTRFRKGEPLFAYFEVYVPKDSDQVANKIEVQVRIIDGKTGEAKSDTGPRDVSSFIQPGNPIIHVSESIAVDKLPVGSYRLEVQASDSADRSTGWRSSTFSVE